MLINRMIFLAKTDKLTLKRTGCLMADAINCRNIFDDGKIELLELFVEIGLSYFANSPKSSHEQCDNS